MTIHLFLVLVALLCFFAAATGWPTRANLIAGGLFLWLLSTIIQR